MKALLVSDIHGNLAALEAVLAEPHDAVACLGDIVGYGPEPALCIRLLRQQGALAVLGNHDRALAEGVPPRCVERYRWLADATAPIARAEVPPADVAYLGMLPRWANWASGAVNFGLVHATPTDPLYGYRPPDPALWRADLEGLTVDGLLVGHTHIQFRLDVGRAGVVNPGSAGQPKDGDARAAYAVVEDGAVTFKRAAYDVERTIRALEEKCPVRAAVDVLASLLRSGRGPEVGGGDGPG